MRGRFPLFICPVVVLMLFILVCQPAAAEEGIVTVGGVQLDLNTLKDALREQVSEQLSEAIKAGREKLEGLPGEAADQTRQFLYGEFKRWVRVQVYKELPEQQREELAREAILPNDDPRFNPYLEKWLKERPEEAGALAKAYLAEASAQKIMADLESGASKEIIDGLGELYSDAGKKLKRFTSAVEEAEQGKTPAADALGKYGFSGPWMDKFKGREAQFRQLQKFNNKFKVVESLQLLTEAFQADMPRQKIGALFGLLEKLGSAAGESRIPIVSFMGQMVENLGKIATEMLAAEERLAKIIRNREGNCLGGAMHDMDDPRQKEYLRRFNAADRICPTSISPDIYVQTEPSDSSKLYFFINGHFLVGNPEGGGLPALHQVNRLLEEAAAANFIRYAGKAADPATLASVYNIPYPPPGDKRFTEKKSAHGTGIPGVMNEAVAVLDGISNRLDAMENLVSGAEQCSKEKLHAFLKSATGLNAEYFHRDESRLGNDLKLHYVMAYIERYKASDDAGGSGNSSAYDTYSPIWEKLEKLSLLRIAGRVAASGGEAACPDCADAAVTGRATGGGGAQVLPVCAADRADRHGAFSAFYAMNAADWALAFRAETASRRTPEETLNPKNSEVPEFPFVTTAEVVLLLPQEKQEAPPPREENTTAVPSPPPGPADSPPAAAGQSGLAGVVAGAIGKCDLDLAETLLAGVSNPVERSALEQALAERRHQHEEFIKVVKQAEAEALGDEPYQAYDKLQEAQQLAPCDRDRQLAEAAARRVKKLLAAIDDGRFTTWVEDALAECRFNDALGFIARISQERRGDLETRAREAMAREDDARSMLEEGRQLISQGRAEEGLARLREARAATRCPKQVSAIDHAIAGVVQPPRRCDEIMKGGIIRREAGGDERCICPDGKVTNRIGNACIDKPQSQVAARQCPDNAEAFWDAEREQPRCRCKSGFRFSREQNACVGGGSAPAMNQLLSDVTANRQNSDDANQGELQAENNRREQSQYADPGPSSREREPQGPDLMGGLVQALGAAVAQSQGVPLPAANTAAALPSGADQVGNVLLSQGAPPPSSGQQGSGSHVSESQRAEWQRILDCLREGKRKYPNYWQDCNGNWTMRDRDVEIHHYEELLANAGGPASSPPASATASQGGDWFVLTTSAFPASDETYRRFPECRYVVGRGMMFVDSMRGGRQEIEASANALRAKGYAFVEVIYSDGRDAQRVAEEWQRREEQGRNACWDATHRNTGGVK